MTAGSIDAIDHGRGAPVVEVAIRGRRRNRPPAPQDTGREAFRPRVNPAGSGDRPRPATKDRRTPR